MAWRDNLQQAHFKGINFYVATHEHATGRDTIRHEYPGKDLTYHEDMKRSLRIYNVRGYVIGEDYFEDRDNLLRACETPGAGTLVHPFLGSIYAICVECRVLEDAIRTGGMATFEMTFEETGDPSIPEPVPDYNALTEAAAEDAYERAAAEALKQLNTAGPGWVQGTFLEDVVNFANFTADVIRSIPELIEQSFVGDLVATLRQVDAALASVGYAIDGTVDWIQRKIEAIGDLETYSQSYAAYNALTETFKWEEDSDSVYFNAMPPIISGTNLKTQAQNNRNATEDLIHVTLVAEACNIAVSLDFPSKNEALFVKDQLFDLLEQEMLRAGETGADEVYVSIRKLRAEVGAALKQKLGTLAEIEEYTVPLATIPSLVFAYSKYEDLSRESEIVDRNSVIIHPGFLPNGETLEVLNA